MGVPLARAAIAQAPVLINNTRTAIETLNSPQNQERVSQIAGVGSRVAASAGNVASRAPVLLRQGTKLAGSIIHAANETAPLIVNVGLSLVVFGLIMLCFQGIQEFTDQVRD